MDAGRASLGVYSLQAYKHCALIHHRTLQQQVCRVIAKHVGALTHSVKLYLQFGPHLNDLQRSVEVPLPSVLLPLVLVCQFIDRQ